MQEDNYIILEMASYNDIAKCCRVLNPKYLNYFIYGRLNPTLTDKYVLVDVRETTDPDSTIWLNAFIKESPTWIKINSTLINKSIGQHIYKFTFVDTQTDDTFSQYLSYIIQDDNPETPYIYMKREDNQ